MVMFIILQGKFKRKDTPSHHGSSIAVKIAKQCKSTKINVYLPLRTNRCIWLLIDVIWT